MKEVLIGTPRPDGGLNITAITLDNGHGIKREYSTELVEAELVRAGLGGFPYRLMDKATDFPPDGAFRKAWSWAEEGRIAVDMVKAVEVHKDRLRAVRKPLLIELDHKQVNAISKGDLQLAADLMDQKQALLDLTDDPIIAAASTPEELKLAIPDVLK